MDSEALYEDHNSNRRVEIQTAAAVLSRDLLRTPQVDDDELEEGQVLDSSGSLQDSKTVGTTEAIDKSNLSEGEVVFMTSGSSNEEDPLKVQSRPSAFHNVERGSDMTTLEAPIPQPLPQRATHVGPMTSTPYHAYNHMSHGWNHYGGYGNPLPYQGMPNWGPTPPSSMWFKAHMKCER